MPADSTSLTQSRVQLSNCIRKNGEVNQVICVCDEPAARMISRTKRNPGRAFYTCASHTCKFWGWEDEIFCNDIGSFRDSALIGTQEKEYQLRDENSAVAQPVTPTERLSRGFPLSPPDTVRLPKRSFATLSTRSGLRRKPSELLSPEARARRMENIRAGLEGKVKEEETPHLLSDQPTQAISVASDTEDEDEPDMPANKRIRFADPEGPGTLNAIDPQMQSEPPSTPTRASRASHPTQLPTPTSSHLGRHEAITTDVGYTSDVSDGTLNSPTSFTKRGRRAMERAQERDSLAMQSASAFLNANTSISELPQRKFSDGYMDSEPQPASFSEKGLVDALQIVQSGLPAILADKSHWKRRATGAEKRITELQEETKNLKAHLAEEIRHANWLKSRLVQLEKESDTGVS